MPFTAQLAAFMSYTDTKNNGFIMPMKKLPNSGDLVWVIPIEHSRKSLIDLSFMETDFKDY